MRLFIIDYGDTFNSPHILWIMTEGLKSNWLYDNGLLVHLYGQTVENYLIKMKDRIIEEL